MGIFFFDQEVQENWIAIIKDNRFSHLGLWWGTPVRVLATDTGDGIVPVTRRQLGMIPFCLFLCKWKRVHKSFGGLEAM